MSNFCNDILDAVNGEAIEYIVIGVMGWGDHGSEAIPGYSNIPKGELLTWNEAVNYLDFDYDNGFGVPGCMSIFAWTESRVLFVDQYNGATSVCTIPRNPIDVMPQIFGGG